MDTPYLQALAAYAWIESMIHDAKAWGATQTKGKLGDWTGGFCCLGFGSCINEIPFNPKAGSSRAFARKVGLFTQDGRPVRPKDRSPLGKYLSPYLPEKDLYSCVGMNDSKGMTFQQIGRKLKANLDYYFKPEVVKHLRIIYS